MRRVYLFFIIFLFYPILNLNAQFYSVGNERPNIRWNKIVGENYTIIYPCEIDSLAKNYYYLLESYRPAILAKSGVNPKPLPIILHPYTSYSNGVVVWAPKRMELFTLPPSYNTYAQSWDKQLVLHETQHVVQMTHFTKGIFKPLGFLIGEQAVGIGAAIYPGIWMMEGDAVITETELSNSGRGRTANFLAYYRASFLNGKYRSWDKWRFGSLKYYAPNAYSLGYLFNSTIRCRLNNYSFEDKIFNLMVKNFFRPNSKSYAYKKVTGKNLRQNFRAGADVMTEIWKKSYDERGEKTNPKFLLNKKSSYYSEYCSVSANANQSDTLFYVKISNDRATSLVMLSKENNIYKETVIRPFSSFTGNSLRYSNNKIYWAEPIEDIRWELNTYNDLFCYDISSKSISRLTNKKYYFNPAINNINGSSYKIAVSEYNPNGTYFLKVLDAENGKELLSFATPDNGQIIESTWLGDKLFCSIITDNGLGIFSLDINSGVWKNIIKENNNNISSLQSCRYKNNDYLYFKSDLDGVDNIYAYNINENNLIRLTNSKYGAENPIILKENLFYTELLLNGKLPAVIPIQMQKMGESYNYYISDSYPIADSLSAQAQKVIKDVETTIQEPIIKPYSKFAHLFNIHSWAPIYYNVDKITRGSYDNFYEVVAPGAVIYSQNLIGTATTMLGYSYRRGNSPVKSAFHAGHIKFTYTGFYPVIEFSADLNSEDRCKLVLKKNANEEKRKLEVQYLDSPNFRAEIKTYIPLSFNRHGWRKGFIPQVSWNINNNRYSYVNSNECVSLQYLKTILQGYIMRPVARAGVFPRYGIGVIEKWHTPVIGSSLFSSAISSKIYFYLPGMWATHGTKFNIEYQRQFVDSKPYYTDNLIDVPRGYDDIVSKNLFRVSFDYALPIYLNDIDLGFFAYLQRLKLIPFIDYGKYTRQDKRGTLCSIGSDVLLDGYFFRIGVPASIGFRYAHLKKDPIYSNNSSGYFSLLFSFSLTK